MEYLSCMNILENRNVLSKNNSVWSESLQEGTSWRRGTWHQRWRGRLCCRRTWWWEPPASTLEATAWHLESSEKTNATDVKWSSVKRKPGTTLLQEGQTRQLSRGSKADTLLVSSLICTFTKGVEMVGDCAPNWPRLQHVCLWPGGRWPRGQTECWCPWTPNDLQV